MKKTQSTNYHSLKKALAPYFKFSFKAPPKNKQFKNQQKSAIVRAFNKISEYLNKDFTVKKNEVTFLKYPVKPKVSKLPHVDGVRTSKGLFYKMPFASLKQLRDSKKWVVVVNPKIKRKKRRFVEDEFVDYDVLVQKRRDIFFPIPEKYLTDINKIKHYVHQLREKYRPHDIMWSYSGKRERVRYEPELFDMYFSNIDLIDEKSNEFSELDIVEKTDVWKTKKFKKKYNETPNYYNGVFFVYYL